MVRLRTQPRLDLVENGVRGHPRRFPERLEALVEALVRAHEGIRGEAGRGVALLLHAFRKRVQSLGQVAGGVVDQSVFRRRQRRQDRRRGRPGPGRRGPRRIEHDAALAQRIQVRRRGLVVAVRRGAIRTQRVDHDDHDVGLVPFDPFPRDLDVLDDLEVGERGGGIARAAFHQLRLDHDRVVTSELELLAAPRPIPVTQLLAVGHLGRVQDVLAVEDAEPDLALALSLVRGSVEPQREAHVSIRRQQAAIELHARGRNHAQGRARRAVELGAIRRRHRPGLDRMRCVLGQDLPPIRFGHERRVNAIHRHQVDRFRITTRDHERGDASQDEGVFPEHGHEDSRRRALRSLVGGDGVRLEILGKEDLGGHPIRRSGGMLLQGIEPGVLTSERRVVPHSTLNSWDPSVVPITPANTWRRKAPDQKTATCWSASMDSVPATPDPSSSSLTNGVVRDLVVGHQLTTVIAEAGLEPRDH